MAKESLTSKKYVDGIYIPAGLLVLGTAITKRDWLPYAVVLAIVLGAFKFLRTRKSIHHAFYVLPAAQPPIRRDETHELILT